MEVRGVNEIVNGRGIYKNIGTVRVGSRIMVSGGGRGNLNREINEEHN